jgi:predicted metal-dependent phosphoesterase TrpH
MTYDLHLHTTASDGRLNPAELVRLARTKGLEVIAITDHDSVGGIDEALEEAGHAPTITAIPGVEINTDLATGELHILGYFIDYRDANLALALEKIRESRVGRAHKMVEKLQELGAPIEWSRVQDMAHGESICRPHIAQALLEKGFVGSEREAFDKYIGRNGPAYVEREKIRPSDAVRMIKSVNGLPVLAHPADIKDLNNLIMELKEAGLVGLEAYYGQYDANTVRRMVRLAGEHGLLTTGGSDYHHFGDDREVSLGSVDIPEDSIIGLFQAAGRMEQYKKK